MPTPIEGTGLPPLRAPDIMVAPLPIDSIPSEPDKYLPPLVSPVPTSGTRSRVLHPKKPRAKSTRLFMLALILALASAVYLYGMLVLRR
jgi:hypothetical protein